MRTATLHVHHIVPRSKGGLSTLENLLTLCEVCHPLVERSSSGI
jgi:5-methylcytosine-specific restriction endonuclease McrA